MIKIVWFENEANYIEDFISLPKKLYGKKEIMQNERDERALLEGKHVLGKYFKLYKMLAYNDGEVIGRLIITEYPNDKSVYVGFFESIDDTNCSHAMFSKGEEFAREHGFMNMIGPVDASFWIKYRLKVNLFDRAPYFSEPYNKEYYLKLFTHYGFEIIETYVSNIYRKIPEKDFNLKKSKDRFDKFTKRGYSIISPPRSDWNKLIGEVYRMIMDLYSSFPIFKSLSEEEFRKICSDLKMILDMSMVKIAYYEGKIVGFFIAVPDYGNKLYHGSFFIKLLHIIIKRNKCSNFILLYMGVDNNHKGLGLAMSQTIMKCLQKKGATSIGALIKEGKPNQFYAKELIEDQYQYVLLEKKLNNTF